MPYLIVLLVGMFWGTSVASAFSPIEIYGDRLEFSVLRDGKVVGAHVTEFRQVEDELYVTSHMTIDIFLLFIHVYGLKYQTVEKWKSAELVSLDVKVVDGGDQLKFSAQRHQDILTVKLEDRSYDIGANVLSTNHWNVDVVDDRQVLNTLTGNLNNVQITAMGEETIAVQGGNLTANRYDYSGDLQDTSVWYDDQGRWVKLRFKARDGSAIEYFCLTCTPGEN